MDLATLIGIVIGITLILVSTAGAAGVEGLVFTFGNAPSAAIVLGGAIAAVLISFPWGEIKDILKVVVKAFRFRKFSPTKIIGDMVRFAEIARRDGILALEGVTDDVDDEFMIRGIQLAVDGTDPELIDQILSTELAYIQDRHTRGRKLFESLGKYAPAFGMIGTLIGLILMLRNLEDLSAIGGNMAVALITTLYGAVAANLVFLPIADKLAARSKEEQFMKQIVIQGVMSIQSGDNPRIVQQKLQIFLSPKVRQELAA